MDTMEKDTLFIAKHVKFLRRHHKLTQEVSPMRRA